MKNPYMANCEHNFCEKCLKSLKRCPIDNEIINNKIFKKKLHTKIENLKVNCPIDIEICEWEDILKNLESNYKHTNFRVDKLESNMYKDFDLIKNQRRGY